MSRAVLFRIALVGFVLSASASSAPAALVQYWLLDDGAGTTAVNSISGGNTATLRPAATGGSGPNWVSSGLPSPLTSRSFLPSTSGLSLNAANQNVLDLGNVGLSSAGGGQASLSMWFRPTSLLSDMRLLGQMNGSGGGGAMRILPNGSMEMWSGGTWLPAAAAGSVLNNSWHHLALVGNSGAMQVYLNGSATGSPLASNFDFAGGNLGIGSKFLSSFGNNFDGLIDEIALWDHAIDAALVSELAAGRALLDPPPRVPEPSTLLLISAFGVGLLHRRRRRVR